MIADDDQTAYTVHGRYIGGLNFGCVIAAIMNFYALSVSQITNKYLIALS